MKKIQNCPNNAFDCGVACGSVITLQAFLKILEKIKDDKKRIEIIKKFDNELHMLISEKHLEHMNERYDWEKILKNLLG